MTLIIARNEPLGPTIYADTTVSQGDRIFSTTDKIVRHNNFAFASCGFASMTQSAPFFLERDLKDFHVNTNKDVYEFYFATRKRVDELKIKDYNNHIALISNCGTYYIDDDGHIQNMAPICIGLGSYEARVLLDLQQPITELYKKVHEMYPIISEQFTSYTLTK